jgi:hypothetical protein
LCSAAVGFTPNLQIAVGTSAAKAVIEFPRRSWHVICGADIRANIEVLHKPAVPFNLTAKLLPFGHRHPAPSLP